MNFGDIAGNHSISRLALTGGSGPYLVSISNEGAGYVAPGNLDIVADGIQDGSTRHKFHTTNNYPIQFEIDFADKTFALEGAMITTEDGFGTLNLHGEIANYPPLADAGTPQTVECESPQGTQVTLDASGSSDMDGNIMFYSWWQGAAFNPAALLPHPDGFTPVSMAVTSPLGVSRYEVSVVDRYYLASVAKTTVSVEDTTPPELSDFIYNGPMCLWPPNHKYVVLRVNRDFEGTVVDICDPAPELVITNAANAQPDNAEGDGDTIDDVVVFSDHVCLRSERQGTDGNGRTYTVQLAALDHSGNKSDPVVQIWVGHDQSEESRCGISLNELEVVEDGDAICVRPPDPPAGVLVEGARAESGGCNAGRAPAAGAGLLLGVVLALGVRLRRASRASS